MAKKPTMPGELKDLLNDMNPVEKETKKAIVKQAEVKKTTVEKAAPATKKTQPTADDGSIDRVIAYAQEYKESEIDMATVVLSEDMKQMLDKLKTSLPVKTPFKYLLSGIIREYFETHKDEIRDLILRF